MVDLSRDSDPDFTALCSLLGFEAPVTKFDAVPDIAAFSAYGNFTGFDAIPDPDDLAPTSAQLSELPMPLRRCGQSDLKNIVDGLFH